MTSYTRVESVTDCHAMVGDGVGNLYVAALDTGIPKISIYQYEIATDTLTDISGATFTGYQYGTGSRGNLTWFDDNLYMVCGETSDGWVTGDVYVFRWNGGTSWTQVDTQSTAGIGTINLFIKSSADRIVWRYSTAGATPLRGSSSGLVWSTDFASGVGDVHYDTEITGDLTATRYDGATTKVYRNTSGSTWVALSGADIGSTYDYLGTSSDWSFFQKRTGTTNVYYSNDWGVTLNLDQEYELAHDEPVVYVGSSVVVGIISTTFPQDQVRIWNNATETFDLDGTPNAADRVAGQEAAFYGGYLYVLVDDDGIYRRDVSFVTSDYTPSTASGSWPMSMDVSPDDYYLHVACLNGGNPVLLRLLADLTADPVAVYAPGAGTAIGVKCGDENDSWVWIGGDFGTPLVRLSIDDGATWTTKDPGTWNGVALPFVVGPWWDNLFLVPTDTDDDLHETEDGGLTWTTLNAGLPIDVGGMDRLDINLDEIVIGSDAGRDVYYSPNNGAAFEDITDISMDDVPITDVIVG